MATQIICNRAPSGEPVTPSGEPVNRAPSGEPVTPSGEPVNRAPSGEPLLFTVPCKRAPSGEPLSCNVLYVRPVSNPSSPEGAPPKYSEQNRPETPDWPECLD